MHLLVAESVELAGRTGTTSGVAPMKSISASPAFRGGAHAQPFVGCCLASIEPDRAVFHPRMHHCPRLTIRAERRSRSLSGMVVLCNRRNGRAVFPTGRLRSPITSWKLARLELLVRNSWMLLKKPMNWPGLAPWVWCSDRLGRGRSPILGEAAGKSPHLPGWGRTKEFI
jgi:hypothetical protein